MNVLSPLKRPIHTLFFLFSSLSVKEIVITLLLSGVITLVFLGWAIKHTLDEEQTQFFYRGQQLATPIQFRLQPAEMGLQVLGHLLEAGISPDSPLIQKTAKTLLKKNAFLHRVAIHQMVQGQDRNAFERQTQKTLPHFTIQDFGFEGPRVWRTSPQRDIHWVSRFIEPTVPYHRALGLDLAGEASYQSVLDSPLLGMQTLTSEPYLFFNGQKGISLSQKFESIHKTHYLVLIAFELTQFLAEMDLSLPSSRVVLSRISSATDRFTEAPLWQSDRRPAGLLGLPSTRFVFYLPHEQKRLFALEIERPILVEHLLTPYHCLILGSGLLGSLLCLVFLSVYKYFLEEKQKEAEYYPFYRYFLSYQYLEEGVILLDQEGKIEALNPAAQIRLKTEGLHYKGKVFEHLFPNVPSPDYRYPLTTLDQKKWGEVLIFLPLSENLPLTAHSFSKEKNTALFLNQILDHVNACIFQKDMTGRYTMINHHFQALLKQPLQHIIGKNDAELFGQETAELFRKNDEKVMRMRQSLVFDENLFFNDELYHFVSMKFPLFDEKGTIKAICGIATDMTHQHELQKQLQIHQADLAHVARLNTLGEMASGMAHELSQPLSSILNYAHASQKYLAHLPNKKDKIEYALGQIVHQTQRTRDIIHRLREFVRKNPQKRTLISLNQLVEDVLELDHYHLQLHEIKIETSFYEPLPDVLADKIQLEQVLINLMRNAIDAMEMTPPAERQLSFKTRLKDEWVELFISDRGIGLTPEVLNSLFMPFMTTKKQGTGLGLMISRGIMETHGGSLDPDPDYGLGARFRMRLPLASKCAAHSSEDSERN